MFRLLFFVGLVAVSYAHNLPPEGALGDIIGVLPSAGRIVGGVETTIDDVPYQVVLLKGGKLHCGASIIAPKAVVSAAHCTGFSPLSKYSIRAGSSTHNSGGQVIRSKRIFNHKSYRKRTNDYDISLVELVNAISFNEFAAQITLAPKGLAVPAGTPALISGWGRTVSQGKTSLVIRKVVVPIVDQDECNRIYKGRITPRMICAGESEGGKDTCQGDSGGPLVADNILIGITSWGRGCAQRGIPGVYVRVSELRDWIDSRLSQIK